MLKLQTEPVVIHRDGRGALVKAWPGPVSGEVYAVELRPGHPRGHHLHVHGGEWFVPLVGAAILVAVDPATGEQAIVRLAGVRVRVEAGIAHALFAEEPAWVLAIADREHTDEQTICYEVPAP